MSDNFFFVMNLVDKYCYFVSTIWHPAYLTSVWYS